MLLIEDVCLVLKTLRKTAPTCSRMNARQTRLLPHLLLHVGISECPVTLPIARKVKAQAAEALLSKGCCHLRQHKAVFVGAQSMTENGNILQADDMSSVPLMTTQSRASDS